MVRSAVVVAMLVLSGAAHGAIRHCDCDAGLLVPFNGTTVPPNAKLWVTLDHTDVGYLTRDGQPREQLQGVWDPTTLVTVFSPTLVAGHYTFQVGYQRTQFTVAGAVDVTAPLLPDTGGDNYITVATSAGSDAAHVVTQLELNGSGEDISLLRVTFKQVGRTAQIRYLQPGNTMQCDPRLMLALVPGDAGLMIEGLDAAGNVSAPRQTAATVLADDADCHRYRHGCGLGATMAVVFAGFLALVGLLSGLVISIVRRLMRSSGEPEPVPMLVAETLARRARKREGISLIVTFALLAIVAPTFGVWEIIVVPWVLFGIIDYAVANRAVRYVETPGAFAHLYGKRLVIQVELAGATLRCTRRQIRRAKATAIPSGRVTV